MCIIPIIEFETLSWQINTGTPAQPVLFQSFEVFFHRGGNQMAKSPLSGKSTSTKTILIGVFGCLFAVFLIGLIMAGIFGMRILRGEGPKLNIPISRSSDDESTEVEGSALDLLADDSIEADENQQTDLTEESGSIFANVVLHPVGELAGGYANLEWKKFLHIVAAEGYSPAQAESRSVFFDLTIDLGEGKFSGFAEGNLSGKEFLHEETGKFSLKDISGTVVENSSGSGFKLEGTGTVNCQIEMVQNYTDGAGNQYTYQRADEFSGQVDLTGRLDLFNSTWELTLMGYFDNGTQSFNFNCRECPVGTWEQ
jgi:hypothetical protein